MSDNIRTFLLFLAVIGTIVIAGEVKAQTSERCDEPRTARHYKDKMISEYEKEYSSNLSLMMYKIELIENGNEDSAISSYLDYLDRACRELTIEELLVKYGDKK